MRPTLNRATTMGKILLAATLGIAAITASSANPITEVKTLTGSIVGTVFKADKAYPIEHHFFPSGSSAVPGTYEYNVYNDNLEKIFTYNEEIADTNYYSRNLSQTNDASFYFSQLLFNTDSEFEYIVYKTKSVTDAEGYQRAEYYGFKIMQSNNNCIADINFDSSMGYYPTIELIDLENNKLLITAEGMNSDYYYLYQPEQGGVLKLIGKSENAKAYPNPVKAGDIFRIDGIRGINGATVTVNQLDGALVKAFSCETEKAEIPTTGMSTGIYIYNVIRNGKILSSGKMIIE